MKQVAFYLVIVGKVPIIVEPAAVTRFRLRFHYPAGLRLATI
jgi:hypothetical protein